MTWTQTSSSTSRGCVGRAGAGPSGLASGGSLVRPAGLVGWTLPERLLLEGPPRPGARMSVRSCYKRDRHWVVALYVGTDVGLPSHRIMRDLDKV